MFLRFFLHTLHLLQAGIGKEGIQGGSYSSFLNKLRSTRDTPVVGKSPKLGSGGGQVGLKGRYGEHEGRGFDCQLYFPSGSSTPGENPRRGACAGPRPLQQQEKRDGVARTGSPRPGKKAWVGVVTLRHYVVREFFIFFSGYCMV